MGLPNLLASVEAPLLRDVAAAACHMLMVPSAECSSRDLEASRNCLTCASYRGFQQIMDKVARNFVS